MNVLERLRDRNCKENIKKYKDELEKFKYLQNPFNVTMSFSNIEAKVEKAVREASPDPHSGQET